MQTIMPIRQRSPTNALPEDPMAFQTIRTRNPDGTSTVYHVHESMANSVPIGGIPGCGGPHQLYGGAPGNIYGGQQPNIVYVQSRDDTNDDDDDESDDDGYEQPTNSSTSVESTALVTQSSTNKRRRRRLCQPSKSTSPLCIATGIIIAISFIIGYIFMIEAIVNHNRNRPSVQASLRSGSSGVSPSPKYPQQQPSPPLPKSEYTVQDGSVLQEQLNLEPRYYMMKPVLTEVTLETMLNNQHKQQQLQQQQQKPSRVQVENIDNGDGTSAVVQPRGTIMGEEHTEKMRTAEMHGAASAKSRDGRLRKKK